jgi:hypothetical protein
MRTTESDMNKHIGPYQRPAPPKKPNLSAKLKAVQAPPRPLHEIEAMSRELMDGAFAGRRKPGRPSVNDRPMTPAERQARRRALSAASEVGDGHGKSSEEAESGGYGAIKLDAIYSRRELEYLDGGDGGEAHTGRRVWIDPEEQRVSVRGLRIGDEELNRRMFAEDELKKIVMEYFTSSNSSPSVPWIATHVGNSPVQTHVRASITLRCKLCPETMTAVEDAKDHLRVDHSNIVKSWFKKLSPSRQFRDMKDYVTVVTPRDGRK